MSLTCRFRESKTIGTRIRSSRESGIRRLASDEIYNLHILSADLAVDAQHAVPIAPLARRLNRRIATPGEERQFESGFWLTSSAVFDGGDHGWLGQTCETTRISAHPFSQGVPHRIGFLGAQPVERVTRANKAICYYSPLRAAELATTVQLLRATCSEGRRESSVRRSVPTLAGLVTCSDGSWSFDDAWSQGSLRASALVSSRVLESAMELTGFRPRVVAMDSVL